MGSPDTVASTPTKLNEQHLADAICEAQTVTVHDATVLWHREERASGRRIAMRHISTYNGCLQSRPLGNLGLVPGFDDNTYSALLEQITLKIASPDVIEDAGNDLGSSMCPLCDQYFYSPRDTVISSSCGQFVHMDCMRTHLRLINGCPVCDRRIYSVADTSFARAVGVLPPTRHDHEELADWILRARQETYSVQDTPLTEELNRLLAQILERLHAAKQCVDNADDVDSLPAKNGVDVGHPLLLAVYLSRPFDINAHDPVAISIIMQCENHGTPARHLYFALAGALGAWSYLRPPHDILLTFPDGAPHFG